MTTCAKCGAEGTGHRPDETECDLRVRLRNEKDANRAIVAGTEAIRAELRDVKAERDRLRTAIRINADETRDLRAAVLLIAKRMEDGGPASSDLLCIWANELRKAVT